MERKLKNTRQQNWSLYPAAQGWRLAVSAFPPSLATAAPKDFATLDEAAVALPARSRVSLSLPLRAVLLEPMTLPASDPAELDGMMRLQLEKTLPYPIEETGSALVVLESSEKESRILALATHQTQINALCKPLRERGVMIEKISPFAMQVAAAGAANEATLFIYKEDGEQVMAISENGKLAFAQTLHGETPEEISADLPRALLDIEMSGIATNFQRVRLEKNCTPLESALRETFAPTPVELFTLPEPPPYTACNLAPAEWQRERKSLERQSQRKSRLFVAAAIYVLLVISGWLYLSYLRREATSFDSQLKSGASEVDTLIASQSRWRALAPAVQPSLTTIELLQQITQSLPADTVQITAFEQDKTGFKVVAETPTANLASVFSDKLKNNPALKSLNLRSETPRGLPNDHWTIAVNGKL